VVVDLTRVMELDITETTGPYSGLIEIRGKSKLDCHHAATADLTEILLRNSEEDDNRRHHIHLLKAAVNGYLIFKLEKNERYYDETGIVSTRLFLVHVKNAYGWKDRPKFQEVFRYTSPFEDNVVRDEASFKILWEKEYFMDPDAHSVSPYMLLAEKNCDGLQFCYTQDGDTYWRIYFEKYLEHPNVNVYFKDGDKKLEARSGGALMLYAITSLDSDVNFVKGDLDFLSSVEFCEHELKQ